METASKGRIANMHINGGREGKIIKSQSKKKKGKKKRGLYGGGENEKRSPDTEKKEC